MVKFRQKLDDPSCELSKLDDVGGQDSRPPPPVGQDLGFCSLGNVTPSPRQVLAQMTLERTHASAVATHSQLHIHINSFTPAAIFAAYALPAIMAASLEAKAETDERPEDTKATPKEPLEAAQSLAGAPVLGQILQSQLALQPKNLRRDTAHHGCHLGRVRGPCAILINRDAGGGSQLQMGGVR